VAVIPVCNEERYIGSVVIRAHTYVDTVIVLDMGSTDATSEIAGAAGAVVVQYEPNRSGLAPLAAGFLKAREYDPDAVITLEGDWTYLLDNVATLTSPVLHGEADVVVGYPVFAHRRTPYRADRSVCRAFSAQALDVFSLIPVSFARGAEIKRVAADYGLQVVDVPIETRPPVKDRHSLVSGGLFILNRLVRFIAHDRRLLIFSTAGVLSMALGALVGLIAVVSSALSGSLLVDMTLIVFFMMLASICLCFLGLMLYGMRLLTHETPWTARVRP